MTDPNRGLSFRIEVYVIAFALEWNYVLLESILLAGRRTHFRGRTLTTWDGV